MRKVIFTVVFGLGIALLVGGGYYHLAGPIAHCSAVYRMTAEIESAGGLELLYFESCFNEARADERLQEVNRAASEPLSTLGHVDKFVAGRPIVIGIPYSYTLYPLGKTRGRYRQSKLLVVAQYRDNRRISAIVDIPPHDTDLETRTVTVNLP